MWRHVAAVRREMGVRTLFNILGPLTNPAGAPNILLGVFHPDLVGILESLCRLGGLSNFFKGLGGLHKKRYCVVVMILFAMCFGKGPQNVGDVSFVADLSRYLKGFRVALKSLAVPSLCLMDLGEPPQTQV